MELWDNQKDLPPMPGLALKCKSACRRDTSEELHSEAADFQDQFHQLCKLSWSSAFDIVFSQSRWLFRSSWISIAPIQMILCQEGLFTTKTCWEISESNCWELRWSLWVVVTATHGASLSCKVYVLIMRISPLRWLEKGNLPQITTILLLYTTAEKNLQG